ncbi:hypothetical protein ACIRPK_35890 [Kitasatospora sp. NPDC101801]|uniref:hypothetical protein n=1 Tax=Kitasatospora sp. NPDC101801 TaxID=3364103 RepID=UPI00382EFA6F
MVFIEALEKGSTVAEAEQAVFDLCGQRIAAEEFADTLVDLEFVASVNGADLPGRTNPESWPWLRPALARWLFRLPVYLWVAGLLVAGVVAAAARERPLPGYHAYFVTGSPAVNVLLSAALFGASVAVHESLHLLASRAAGIHARIGFGTRLQFLAVQTTASGLWAAPRRIRYRVYLAGMTGDLCIAALCSIGMELVGIGSFADRVFQVLLLARLVSVAYQFCLFMKTDMYFVVQELMRCKNLYADSWTYARYLYARATGRFGAKGPRPANPTAALPARERLPVKLYAIFMLIGSAICLGLFIFYGLPLTVTIFATAISTTLDGMAHSDPIRAMDGLSVLVAEGVFQAIFLRTFAKKHGPRLRRFLCPGGRRRAAPRPPG